MQAVAAIVVAARGEEEDLHDRLGMRKSLIQ